MNEGILVLAALFVTLGILSMIPWILLAIFISKFFLLGCIPGGILGFLLVRKAYTQKSYENKTN